MFKALATAAVVSKRLAKRPVKATPPNATPVNKAAKPVAAQLKEAVGYVRVPVKNHTGKTIFHEKVPIPINVLKTSPQGQKKTREFQSIKKQIKNNAAFAKSLVQKEIQSQSNADAAYARNFNQIQRNAAVAKQYARLSGHPQILPSELKRTKRVSNNPQSLKPFLVPTNMRVANALFGPRIQKQQSEAANLERQILKSQEYNPKQTFIGPLPQFNPQSPATLQHSPSSAHPQHSLESAIKQISLKAEKAEREEKLAAIKAARKLKKSKKSKAAATNNENSNENSNENIYSLENLERQIAKSKGEGSAPGQNSTSSPFNNKTKTKKIKKGSAEDIEIHYNYTKEFLKHGLKHGLVEIEDYERNLRNIQEDYLTNIQKQLNNYYNDEPYINFTPKNKAEIEKLQRLSDKILQQVQSHSELDQLPVPQVVLSANQKAQQNAENKILQQRLAALRQN